MVFANSEKKTFRLRTIQYLKNYNWPGNVRELENMVYRLLTDCVSEAVGPEQLDPGFFSRPLSTQESNYQQLKKKQEREERDLV